MLSEQRITLTVDTSVCDFIAETGFSDVYGARPLKRVLQAQLLNRLAVMLLDGSIREAENVKVEMRDGDIYVVPNHEPVSTVNADEALPLLDTLQ